MRKIIYAMSVSLDGYIEAAGGDLSWSYPDEELHEHFNAREKLSDTVLYGRGLYENMAAYWPNAAKNPSATEFEKEFARTWLAEEKVVFSKTLTHVDWNSRLVSGDLAGEVQRLKAQPGGDMLVGGAGLAASFMRLGLIDEFGLYVNPVLLGGGKSMFPRPGDRLALRRVETHTFGSGVVLLVYRKI